MATIYDVAKLAEVSPKTVSRVLNGDGPVGQKTRDAVEAAIAELGYVRSNAARMMRSARSNLVGLVTGAISTSFDSSRPTGLPDLVIVQGIQKVLALAGKTVMIADTGGELSRVPSLFRIFQEHQVEGLIYVAASHCQVELPTAPADLPLVLANCFDSSGLPSLVPDDTAGQRALTEALIAAGHRRIAYVTLGERVLATRLRTEGYREALAAHGIADDPALVVTGYRDGYVEDGRLFEAAIDSVLALPDPPSVLCFGNDEMAMRGYGILRSRGLSIPEDVSVAGYDDYRAVAETLFPSLTTVDLAYREIGEAAARHLMQIIDTPDAPAMSGLIGGEVVWRDSVIRLSPLKTN